MKKLLNKTAVLFCLTLVFALFSYNTAEAQSDNANIVTTENGSTYWIADSCVAPVVWSDKFRIQSSKHFVHVTVFFTLPEGHCDIPEKGSVTTRYDAYTWSTVSSKGKVMAKYRVNKKDF